VNWLLMIVTIALLQSEEVAGSSVQLIPTTNHSSANRSQNFLLFLLSAPVGR
jgi:hypothetical protein